MARVSWSVPHFVASKIARHYGIVWYRSQVLENGIFGMCDFGEKSVSENRTSQNLALAVRQAVSGPDENYLFYHAN